MDRVNGLIGPSSSDSGPEIWHRSHRARGACFANNRQGPMEIFACWARRAAIG